MRRLYLVPLIIILAFALILGSCGEAEETTQTTSQTTTQTTTAVDTKSGGTLRIYYSGEPSNIGKPTVDDNWGTIMQLCAVECLARADNTGTLYPWLAESWEGDADANTLTVYLRKGIKFHGILVHSKDTARIQNAGEVSDTGELTESDNWEIGNIADDTVYTFELNRRFYDNKIYLGGVYGYNMYRQYANADKTDTYNPVYVDELENQISQDGTMTRGKIELDNYLWQGIIL